MGGRTEQRREKKEFNVKAYYSIESGRRGGLSKESVCSAMHNCTLPLGRYREENGRQDGR